jgi:hypothetical protein
VKNKRIKINMNYNKQIIELESLSLETLIKSNFQNLNQLIDYHFQIYLDRYKPNHKIYQIFDQNQSNSREYIYRRIYYTHPDENHPLVCQYHAYNKNKYNYIYQIYVIDTMTIDREDFKLYKYNQFLDNLDKHYLYGLLANIEASLHIRKFKIFEDPRYRLDICSKIKNCQYRLRLVNPTYREHFKLSYQIKAQQHLHEYWNLAQNNPQRAELKIKELESFFRYKNDTNHLKIIIILFEIQKHIKNKI